MQRQKLDYCPMRERLHLCIRNYHFFSTFELAVASAISWPMRLRSVKAQVVFGAALWWPDEAQPAPPQPLPVISQWLPSPQNYS